MTTLLKSCALAIACCLLWHLPVRSQVVINEYSVSNLDVVQDNYQEYEDWIEIYNKGFSSVNIGGYYLSDDPKDSLMWSFPAGTIIPSGGFLIVWASGRNEVAGGHYHAGFRLTQTKADPDWIVLSDAGGVILDRVQLETTQTNHSRGLAPNGGDSWAIFTDPTPGYSNNSSTAYTRYAAAAIVSDSAGFYPSPMSVTITTAEPNGTIKYTTDGTLPVNSSSTYTVPVSIMTTKILKARVFSSDPSALPGFVEFNTYFINESHNLPVLSVAGNELQDLLNGDASLRPRGSIEFFNSLHQRTTTAYGEFNEHGQDSWVHPQRSIDYITRDEAGYNYALQEKFFPLSDRDEFQRVILRAAGDDNYPGIDTSAHLRDDFVQTLSQRAGQHLDWRKSRRIAMYANGEYWGIYSIREKVHDHDYTDYYYDQGKYDIQFIMLWGWTWAEYGGQQALDDWYELHDFIMTHNMSNQFVYQAVAAQYDVTSLVDYVIINSYVVCSDWMNWNVGWWRGLNPEGSHRKWAYILWDEDATFGHYINYTGIPSQTPYVSPCFPEDLTGGSDPEGHIRVLNKLRENAEFDQYYISRYIDLLNTAFTDEFMLSLLDSMAAVIAPEMQQHTARWGGNYTQWQNNVQKIRNFIITRNNVISEGLMECYNLTGPYPLVINADPPGIGQVRINSLDLSDYPWDGNYYGGVDVILTATSLNPYFEFDRWVLKNHAASPADTVESITLSLLTGDSIMALFKPRVFEDSLVINEINYNSSASFDPGDWVELYNPHPYDLDVSGWVFKDEDDQHVYELPAGTVMPAEGYLVLANDTAAFRSLFPEVDNFLGPLGYGFSGNGELLRLFDDDGVEIDTVHYDDTEPWPTEPDGNGPTLELINPAWDNALAESWTASAQNGTPGKVNGTFVQVAEAPTAEFSVTCRIMPNPFRDRATLLVSATGELNDAVINIYNVFGNLVRKLEGVSASMVPLYRENLPAGLYLYQLADKKGNTLFTGKFIVN